MKKIAKRGAKILWGTSPHEPGIIENTKTGERIKTPVSVYATMNRGYWYPIDDERDSNTRDSIADSLKGRK